MNSGDGFFKQGRYAGAMSPVGSRVGSPFEYARGRGEKGLAPSMQDKVSPQPSFLHIIFLSFRLSVCGSLMLPSPRSSPSPPTQAHGAPTSHPPTQNPTTTCTTRTPNATGNTIAAGASSPSEDS